MPHVVVKLWPGKPDQQKARLTEKITQDVMEVHRRAEARANLVFSQRQVRMFLARFSDVTPRYRQWLFRICATLMETAGQYA